MINFDSVYKTIWRVPPNGIVRNKQVYLVDSAKYFSKYIIFKAGFAGQEVLNKDTTLGLDGARPLTKHVL